MFVYSQAWGWLSIDTRVSSHTPGCTGCPRCGTAALHAPRQLRSLPGPAGPPPPPHCPAAPHGAAPWWVQGTLCYKAPAINLPASPPSRTAACYQPRASAPGAAARISILPMHPISPAGATVCRARQPRQAPGQSHNQHAGCRAAGLAHKLATSSGHQSRTVHAASGRPEDCAQASPYALLWRRWQLPRTGMESSASRREPAGEELRHPSATP